jgi:uncharacterized C2H2 Zn-finger protein
MECEYCKNIFSKKNNLKSHQKKAKYCLEIQGKTAEITFPCPICKKVFTRKHIMRDHLDRHSEIDIESSREIKKIQKENEKLIIELSYKDDIISKMEETIKRQERALERIASKPNTTNNTLNINNFSPLTKQMFLAKASNLTIEHMKEADGEGYAKFIEDTVRGNISCPDYSRSILKWKDEKAIINDPKGDKLWKLWCQANQNRNDELFQQLQPQIQLQINKDPEGGLEEALRITENRRAIRDGAEGTTSDLQRIVVERICRMAKT